MDYSFASPIPVKTTSISIEKMRKQYYSPFDDLFGLAALVSKPSCSLSLSGSPDSTGKHSWLEHETEKSESDEGSVFGSEKDPASPTGYLSLQTEDVSFLGSPPGIFDFPVKPFRGGLKENTHHLNTSSGHSRLNTVPGIKGTQPFMTMTYEDFLKTIDNLSPLISSSNNAIPAAKTTVGGSAYQSCATNFTNSNLAARRNSYTTLSGEKKQPQMVRYCVFCKNNGEEEYFYNNHVLKSDNGIIVCPVLRAYQCPICHASGDYAHTIKYCPLGKGNEQEWLTTRNAANKNSGNPIRFSK